MKYSHNTFVLFEKFVRKFGQYLKKWQIRWRACRILLDTVRWSNGKQHTRTVQSRNRFAIFHSIQTEGQGKSLCELLERTSSTVLAYIVSRYIVESGILDIYMYSDCGEFFTVSVHFAFLRHYLVIQNIQTLLHR